MAELKITIPGADELSVINYLLAEIKEERAYNEAYKKAMDDACRKKRKRGRLLLELYASGI